MANGVDLESIRADEIGFEDSRPLELLQAEIFKRRSALGGGDYPRAYERNPLNAKWINELRTAIIGLAPSFVDMDFDYYAGNWQTFPQYYSAEKIARSEHPLSVLPFPLCSFDETTLAAYREFFANARYWLGKFQYVAAGSLTKVDAIQSRRWSYIVDAPPWGEGEDTITATENGETVEKGEGGLENGTAAILRREYEDGYTIGNEGYSVGYSESKLETISYAVARRSGLHRLRDYEHTFETNDMPRNLTTFNRSAFNVALLWYAIPGCQNWKNAKRMYTEEPWTSEVTQFEAGSKVDWDGGQVQFYNATDGTETAETKAAYRGQLKQTYLKEQTRTQRRIKETVYSEDGERSLVTRDETTPGNYGYPSDNFVRFEEYLFDGFGLVPSLSQAHPVALSLPIAPHGSAVWQFSQAGAIRRPSKPLPEKPHIGIQDKPGINSTVWVSCYRRTYLVPVFDFGDFEIPEPEEN